MSGNMSKKGFGSRESFQRCEDPSDLFYLIRHPTSTVAAKAVPPPDMRPKVDPLITRFEERLEQGEAGAGFAKFVALAIGMPPYFLFYRFPKWLFGTVIPRFFKLLFLPLQMLKRNCRKGILGGKEKYVQFLLRFKRTKKPEQEAPKKAPWSLDNWVKKKLFIVWSPVKNALVKPFVLPFQWISSGCNYITKTIKSVKFEIKALALRISSSCKVKISRYKNTLHRLIVQPILCVIKPKRRALHSFFQFGKAKIWAICFAVYEWVTKPREKFQESLNSIAEKIAAMVAKPKKWIKFSRALYKEKKTAFLAIAKEGPLYATKGISRLLDLIEHKWESIQQNISALLKGILKDRAPKLRKKTAEKMKMRKVSRVSGKLRRVSLRVRARIRKKLRSGKRMTIRCLRQFFAPVHRLIKLSSSRSVLFLKGMAGAFGRPVKNVADKGMYGARWCRAWMVVLSRYGWMIIRSTSNTIRLPFEEIEMVVK